MRMDKRDFKWTVSLVKGVRDLAQTALFAGLTAAGAAFFGGLDAETLASFEVPAWAVPVLLAGFTAARNVLRNRYGLKV